MFNSFQEERKVKSYIKDAIPYYEIIEEIGDERLNNAIVQCRNGKVFSVYKLCLKGDKMDMKIDEERTAKWTSLLTMFDKRFELCFDTVKQMNHYEYKTNDYIDEKLKSCIEVENIRKKFFEKDTIIYSTTIYLSICFQITTKNKKTIFSKDDLEVFKNALLILESFFQSLGVKEERDGSFGVLLKADELYSYLSKSFQNNFYEYKCKVPYSSINEALSESVEIYPSTIPLKIEGDIIQCWTLKELPLRTFSNMYSCFLNIGLPLRVITKYIPYSKEETQKYLYAKRDEFKTHQFRMRDVIDKAAHGGQLDPDEVDFSAMSGKMECDSAILHTEQENLIGGMYSITIIASSLQEDENFLKREIEAINRIAAEQGLKVKLEKKNNTFAYLAAVLIGTKLDYHRRFMICDNVADGIIISGSDESIFSPHLEEITHSDVPYIVGLRMDNSIYNFSPSGETGNSGHTFITGITGSGKSITLALMGQQYLKYSNTRVVYIDMGLSMLNFVRGNGGKIFYPTVDKTSFAPFHRAEENQDHIIAFVEGIMAANKKTLDDKEDLAIRDTCKSLSELNYGEETLSNFTAALRGKLGNVNSSLVGTLAQYEKMSNGIFNSKEDCFDNPPRVIGIELEGLFGGQSSKLIYPSLIYLFNRLENLFEGSHPCLLILDEAWRFLKDEFFKSYIQNWLKTLRKKNAFVFIATQEINDLTSNEIASTIISNCHTRIFLSNPHAIEPGSIDAYRKLGLQDFEIGLVSSLPQFHNIIMQESNIEAVNFCVGDSLKYLKTTEEEKAKFKKELENEN